MEQYMERSHDSCIAALEGESEQNNYSVSGTIQGKDKGVLNYSITCRHYRKVMW
jgi:hypothetical protein